jgi:hypothetical protein
VQDHGDVAGLPVAEHVEQVGAAVALPLDERGRVADRLLLGEDLRDVVVHRFRRDLHVADGAIRERLGVRLPDRDRVRHQFAHGGLEVVVADDAARDAGRARADAGLVQDEDVFAAAEAAAAEFGGEMPPGREPVDARADDHVPAVGGDRHACVRHICVGRRVHRRGLLRYNCRIGNTISLLEKS